MMNIHYTDLRIFIVQIVNLMLKEVYNIGIYRTFKLHCIVFRLSL